MDIEKLKTIDMNVKEWFDKINGNSYFSGEVTLNYGLKDSVILKLAFQYGYGEHYQTEGFKLIKDYFVLDEKLNSLRRFCEDNKIILRCNKEENCLKRELV